MVAELLEGGDLRANRHHVSINFYFGRAALDRETARARGLEADKDHGVLGVRQPLHKVVLNAAPGHHAA